MTRWLALAWLGLGGAGCSDSAHTSLRIGTHVWPGYETLFLAQEKGFFEGAPIKLIELPTASESIRAFENDGVDVSTLTLDEVLRLAAKGHEPRIIAVMDFSRGADAVLAQPGTSTLSDLRGKRIGLEMNAVGAYLLTRALESEGMATRDVTLVPLAIAETETAFRAGIVQAVVTYEPYSTRLRAEGARLLFDSARVPDEIADVMVVRRELLERSPSALKRLVRGQFRAVEFLRQNPAEAARLMALREGLNSDQFLKALEGLHIPDRDENARLLESTNSVLHATMRRLARTMRERHLLEREVEISTLLEGFRKVRDFE